MNERHLVDIDGQGFYKVTEEGKEYLDKGELPASPTRHPASVPNSAMSAPRALLSYSWDGPEHQQWVNDLAKRLQEQSGVKVVFDQWCLNPGDDRLHFMERGVADSDFVIVICTPTYAERANKRKRGVGYESMVITAELAKNILTNKFIPVLRGGTWDLSLPTYLESKMGVDLSGEPYSEPEYEKLLRVLHGENIQPPPLGEKPDFSRKSTTGVKLSSTVGAVPEVSPKRQTNGEAIGVSDKRRLNGPQPLSGRDYLYVALIMFGIGIVLLAALVLWAPRLIPAGTLDRFYYIVLLVWGLTSAMVLFGVMRSYAHITYRKPGGGLAVELGGAAAFAVLVVVGGFRLLPQGTFNLTVRPHGPTTPLITWGKIRIEFGTNASTVLVNESGEADFKGVPHEFLGASVKILPEMT